MPAKIILKLSFRPDTVIHVVLCLTLYLALGTTSSIAATPPINVLFILTDNQPASILGAYGNPDVRTPNIDRLAQQGMLFTNAFAANGLCSPTRATLMTGLMPSQHGIHSWLDDSKLKDWPRSWSAIAEYRTLPLTLANRGYQTAMIGKWHLGQPWKASLGFDHWVTFTEGHTVDFWDNTIVENGETYQVEGQHTVDFFADKALDYLANVDGNKPFYLQLNFNGPYLNPPSNQGSARNRYYDTYADSDFSSFPRVAVNDNIAQQLVTPGTTDFLIGKHLETIAMHNDRDTMANVASQNTLVDDAVGRVMAALKKHGLDETTLVIFSSDQGNFYGQHGLWQHTVVTSPPNLYEAALNIPLIVRQPGKIRSGNANACLTGQYDIPVTILDYLDIDVSFANSPGRSFANQLQGKSSGCRDEIFYEQEISRGIRTPEFAYWKRLSGTGSDELYDMKSDPGQHSNLIENPGYRATVADLDSRLNSFFKTYSDPQYNLWQGGTAKGSVDRAHVFRKMYGDDWAPKTELLEPFTE